MISSRGNHTRRRYKCQPSRWITYYEDIVYLCIPTLVSFIRTIIVPAQLEGLSTVGVSIQIHGDKFTVSTKGTMIFIPSRYIFPCSASFDKDIHVKKIAVAKVLVIRIILQYQVIISFGINYRRMDLCIKFCHSECIRADSGSITITTIIAFPIIPGGIPGKCFGAVADCPPSLRREYAIVEILSKKYLAYHELCNTGFFRSLNF